MTKTCKLINDKESCKTQKGCSWENNQCISNLLNENDEKIKYIYPTITIIKLLQKTIT